MTADPCKNHETRDAVFVALVETTTGRAVYRLCADCAVTRPTALPLPRRVDVPVRAR